MTAVTIVPSNCSANYCSQTSWTIQGILDISSYSSSVQAYTDGYRVTSTLYVNSVAVNQMQGTCVVYFGYFKEMNNTNGAICHVVTVDETTQTSMETNGNQLYHLPAAVWPAPSTSTSTNTSTISNYKLTNEKYGL